MRALLQRVSRAEVRVEDESVGSVERGLCILLGIAHGDTEADAEFLAGKAAGLRIFSDDAGKMNLSVTDIGGACLVVSQFTLHADLKRGRRPFFGNAEAPERANALFEHFVAALRSQGPSVETGRFGAMMEVELVNDGPVTIWMDSAELRGSN